jgi:hypothetical protein
VQKIGADARLKWRIAFVAIGFLWLAMIGFVVGFAWFVFSEAPILTFFMEILMLVVVGVMAFLLRMFWRAAFVSRESPWVELLQGGFRIELNADSESKNTQYFVGGKEVQLPPGWLDHLHESDVLHGLGYEIDALNADTGSKVLILALDNGLSVDREIGLGLLHLTGLGYWLAAVIAGFSWFLIGAPGSLAKNPLLAWSSFWIPGVVTCTLFALAVARAIRNRPIRRRLAELRGQCIASQVAIAPAPTPGPAPAPAAAPAEPEAQSSFDALVPPSFMRPGSPRYARTASSNRGCLALIATGLVIAIGGWLISAYWHVGFGRPLGMRCGQPNDCKSSTCVTSRGIGLGGGVCSRPCTHDGECDDLRCDGRFCVPRGTREVGVYCESPWDCASMICVSDRKPWNSPLDPAGVCGRKCTGPNPCPDPATCVEIGDDQRVCAEK